MKPIEFKEKNCVYAEHQPEYLPLPAHKTKDGRVISCWQLSFKERLQALFKGKVWFMVMTFNKNLQPQLPSIESPFTS